MNHQEYISIKNKARKERNKWKKKKNSITSHPIKKYNINKIFRHALMIRDTDLMMRLKLYHAGKKYVNIMLKCKFKYL